MKRIAHLVAAGLLLSLPAAAHTPQQPPHQLYSEGDLKLESGETIKDFSISYVTHGTLNASKSNAILMVTAISGNHHRLDFMIGPGKALDPDKYFIICTDAISNGLTTSPSNSKAQPRMQFPKFVIRDMVESQYRLRERKIRHRSSRGGDRSVDGRHADAAMGRQPSRFHGCAGGDRAAGEDAGLDGGGAAGHARGDHGRSGLEGRQLRGTAGEGHPVVARHPQSGGAHAGHVFGAVQERHRRAAVDDGAGERHDEGVRRRRLDLPDLGL